MEGGEEKKETERGRKKERETDRKTRDCHFKLKVSQSSKHKEKWKPTKKSFAFNSFNFSIPATKRPNSIVAVNILAVLDKNSNGLKQINAPKCTTSNKLTFKT